MSLHWLVGQCVGESNPNLRCVVPLLTFLGGLRMVKCDYCRSPMNNPEDRCLNCGANPPKPQAILTIRFCSRCGSKLKLFDLMEYDTATGKVKQKLYCSNEKCCNNPLHNHRYEVSWFFLKFFPVMSDRCADCGERAWDC